MNPVEVPVGSAMAEFDQEEPTKPERTETLEETIARLTGRTPTRERPTIRSKKPTEIPETP
jgi:hypothetical protein